MGRHFLLPIGAQTGYEQNNSYHPGKWYTGKTECYTEEQVESAVREKEDCLKIQKWLQKWQQNQGFVIVVNQSENIKVSKTIKN